MNQKLSVEAGNRDAVAFVIFGVTGDLTRRKLIPALYQLVAQDRMQVPIHIIGFARRDWPDGKLREVIETSVEEAIQGKSSQDSIKLLTENIHYIQSSFDNAQGYEVLRNYLTEQGIANVIFYLATPPGEYLEIIRQIGAAKLPKGRSGWTRIVVEKPYGSDLKSAQQLEIDIHRVFDEHQIYRIDHYLGKETVQNILVLRFANAIFEPLWNRAYVDHVQITVSETVGVGTRAGYYESAGVIRDMFQNHLLQLLTLTGMEAPAAFNADSVRDEKVKVLKALRPFRGSDALRNTYRAQYTSGRVGGEKVVGYKDEEGVRPDSVTETFLAARLFVDNWRWSGVPFYLRSGKRLPARLTEISIHFKHAPLSLFNWKDVSGEAPTMLVMNLQPDEGVRLIFGAKVPGPTTKIAPVKMEFDYEETFGSEPPDAYERLLQDVFQGDPTLFTRSDEVAAQWAFTANLLAGWEESPVRNLPVYEAGTWGPPGADEFLRQDGRNWRECG